MDILYIIPADREEYLYLLNLKKMKKIQIQKMGEQGWLNAVYLWEKFDIGLEFNVRIGVMQVGCYQEIFVEKYKNFLPTRKEGWEATCKMPLFSTLLGCSSPTIVLRNTSC